MLLSVAILFVPFASGAFNCTATDGWLGAETAVADMTTLMAWKCREDPQKSVCEAFMSLADQDIYIKEGLQAREIFIFKSDGSFSYVVATYAHFKELEQKYNIELKSPLAPAKSSLRNPYEGKMLSSVCSRMAWKIDRIRAHAKSLRHCSGRNAEFRGHIIQLPYGLVNLKMENFRGIDADPKKDKPCKVSQTFKQF